MLTRKLCCSWLLLTVAATALSAATPEEIEHKIDALLARMTVEEKLGQMSHERLPRGLPDKTKDELRKGRWGALDGGTPQEKAEAQRIATKESRLGIPLIYGHDVIHGYQTVFPIPLGESASWDPKLVRQAARIAAREASSAGIHWTFAPMMDIARDPRWGRIAETLGEDPYLAGVLAAAMVRGFQGDSLDAPESIAACGKHYVGYGAAEAGRDYNTTWIPEYLLRDVYLRPFQAARQAGIATYMSAFNDLNGVPASANEFTLRRVLRDEWKFDGFVVSDFHAVTELINHGYAADEKDAALKAIKGGVDMEMGSDNYYDYGKALIDEGALDLKLVDQEVRNILRIKYRLGLFDNRTQPSGSLPTEPSAEALDVAKRLAAESLVLLKNEDGALPLAKSVRKVAVIGPLADSPRDQMGTWVVDGNRNAVRTPLAALRETLGETRIAWAQGLKNSRDTGRSGFPAALEAARAADTVLLFLGEDAGLSGEASSRAFLNLPGAQEELATELAKAGKPMIAVILAGRPLTFHNLAEQMTAVLYAWHPGTMGGPAICDVLFGDIVPSGKLTTTFPRSVGQVPIYYNHMNTGRPAAEFGPEGKDRYTSKYLDVSYTPEYPFGFGLSYTKFEYSNLRLSSPRVRRGEKLTISADIENVGKYEAEDIVQLYTRQLAASLTRPVRELKSFRRVHLKAGEKQSVQFVLSTDDLAFYSPGGQLTTEPGAFQLWVAPDSASGEKADFQVVR